MDFQGQQHTQIVPLDDSQLMPDAKLMTSWPTRLQLNVLAFDDYYYGDADGDGVLDRLPPNSVGTS